MANDNVRKYGATADQVLSVLDGLTSQEILSRKDRAAALGVKLSELIADSLDNSSLVAVDTGVLVPHVHESAVQCQCRLQDRNQGDVQPGVKNSKDKPSLKRKLKGGAKSTHNKRSKRSQRKRIANKDQLPAGAGASAQHGGGSSLLPASTASLQSRRHAGNQLEGEALKEEEVTWNATNKPEVLQDTGHAVVPRVTNGLNPQSRCEPEVSEHAKLEESGLPTTNQSERFEDDIRVKNGAAPDDFPDVPSTQDWMRWAESPVGKAVLLSPAVKPSGKRDPFRKQDSFISLASSCSTTPTRWGKACCTQESPCPQRWQVHGSHQSGQKYYAVRRGRKLGIYHRWDGDDGAQVQVSRFLGSMHKSFRTSEHAEQYMNTPSVAGCWRSTRCTECTQALDPYALSARSSVCAACAIDYVVKLHGLCDEQRAILDIVSKGRNVFFTGAAGTGKSTTLKAIMRLLDKVNKVARAVAPTGIAALLLGGTTIHVFAGWNVKAAKELSLSEMKRNAWGEKNRDRLQQVDVLIIDEISMVENSMFSRLDAILREVGVRDLPFGGVQLIVSGDFHQLPPKWAFASDAWQNCGFVYRRLVQIHRQADIAFVTLLNRLRKGALTESEENLLIDHNIDFDQSEAVQIYPFRRKVDYINDSKLAALPDTACTYHCVDGRQWNSDAHPELKDRFIRVDNNPSMPFRWYQEERHRFSDGLELKKGMPVLLLANIGIRDGLVNGSRGKLVDFEPIDPHHLPHKSRGSKEKEHFSSGRVLNGEHAVYQEAEIRDFAQRIPPTGCWPVVEFENGVTRTIYPHCQVAELGRKKPYSLMSRTQTPLVAGWAITIHKSQGMTILHAVVDADRSWEYGQSYVAMSRVKSLGGLLVHGLASGKAMRADPTVLEFMKATFGDDQNDVVLSDTGK